MLIPNHSDSGESKTLLMDVKMVSANFGICPRELIRIV